MIYNLSNQNLEIDIDTKGAEIKRVRGLFTSYEYIWNGDKNYWARHAPVLFPHVGKLKNNQLIINKISHVSKQHGFARDLEFECISSFENHLIFQLESNESTKSLFPFDFVFQISYLIEGNSLKISYRVINRGDNTMYFGIGAHPAFSCPIKSTRLEENTSFEGYLINFEKEEQLQTYRLNEGLINSKPELLEENSSMIHLTRELFDQDALIFNNLKSSWVGLAHFEIGQIVKVYSKEFNWLGIWSLNKDGADFVCIEPWQSHADFVDEIEGFENKKDIILLKPESDWVKSFEIEFCLS
jgi:galactose mutarotase-like enzyme